MKAPPRLRQGLSQNCASCSPRGPNASPGIRLTGSNGWSMRCLCPSPVKTVIALLLIDERLFVREALGLRPPTAEPAPSPAAPPAGARDEAPAVASRDTGLDSKSSSSSCRRRCRRSAAVALNHAASACATETSTSSARGVQMNGHVFGQGADDVGTLSTRLSHQILFLCERKQKTLTADETEKATRVDRVRTGRQLSSIGVTGDPALSDK
jgi:hypothetical protein